MRLRRFPPIPYGRWVLAGTLLYELVALTGVTPTISSLVRREPWLGWVLLAALAYHWWLEVPPSRQKD
jgi:hypothetical protein